MAEFRRIERHYDKWRARVRRAGRCYYGPSQPTQEEAMSDARDILARLTVQPEPAQSEPSLPTDDLWAAYERVQVVQRAAELEKLEVTIQLPGDEPYLVIWTADWHAGAEACRMAELRADLQLAGRTPGVILGLGGDLIENTIATSPLGAQFDQLASPKAQRQLLQQAVGWTNGHIGWVHIGNHEARTVAAADYDPSESLASSLKVPYLGPWGIVHLKLGSQQYDVLSGHRYRYNSSFNRTHTAKRMLDFVADVDAVFLGHFHEPDSELAQMRGRARFLGIAGTYQETDTFSRSKGYMPGCWRMPGLILMPDEHRFVGTGDAFVDGIHLLASYRRDVTCLCHYCTRRGSLSAA